ncbi:MAG: hypothetical protein KF752_18105 [Pirellulaceae bacterium]|nr:hypothetical protein [Pirellulaceae bacterium]
MRQLFFQLKQMACVASLALASLTTTVQADPVVLSVNSAQSNLTISGQAFGLPYAQQNAGSMTTSLSGTITGDLTGGVFTFSGGSAIAVDVNPTGPYSHAPFTFESSLTRPGNFGIRGDGAVFGFGFVHVLGLYEDLTIDLPSGTAQNGSPTAATFRFTVGRLVWGAQNEDVPPLTTGGTSSLVNVSGTNTAASNVAWDGTTLTIPVQFQTVGSNRIENWAGTIVATLAAPAATLVNKRVYHNGFSGTMGSPPWNAVNPTNELIQRSNNPQQIGLVNLTNDSRGLNGVVLDFDNLASLNDISLEYKMSPQGAFNEGAHPVSGWEGAPAPTSVTLHPDLAEAGGNDRVRILWANNAIQNRYLCIKVTIGSTSVELYIGHLLGETTGPDALPVFTVSFADITQIKNTVAQIVDAGGLTDIDKNGTVAFADITAMRNNVSAQLTRITIPANP